MSVTMILLIILIVLLIGAAPGWQFHSAGWGPSGGIGLVLVVLLILVLLGKI